MPSRIHESVVRTICDRHGSSPRLFSRAMVELYRQAEPDDPEGVAHMRNMTRFRPDAWKVDGRFVWCWEVTVTGSLPSKEGQYIEAWWALDEIGYQLCLVHVDPGGNEAVVDLFNVAYGSAKAAG